MGILAELASRWWWAPLISPVNATAQFLWKHLYLLLKVHVVIIYQEIPSFTRTEDNKEKIADKKCKCHVSFYLSCFGDIHRIMQANTCFYLSAKISPGEYFIQHMALALPVN